MKFPRALKFIILFLTAMSFVFSWNNSAHAANKAFGKKDIFERFMKALPEIPPIAEEEFLKQTKLVRKKPYGEEVLEYSLRIPKDWKEREDRSSSNFILSEKLFLELNTFYGKPTIYGRSRLEIQALNVEGNLTAEQWYLKYILEGGYTTEGFESTGDNMVESLMIVMEKDFSYYLRTVIIINGSKIIMARYYVPVQLMQEQAAMQAQVLGTFKVLNKSERAEMDMKDFRFLDVAEIKYPLNWKIVASPPRSVDRMDVSLINAREIKDKYGSTRSLTTEGKIDVSLVSSSVNSSLIEEIEAYKKKIESTGMLVGERLELTDEITYGEGIDFAITEAYKGLDSSNSSSEYEFWFSVMVGGNYYYFIMLLTPSRNENFAVWAENTQNYKVMMGKFTPMVGAFLDRE